MIDIISAKENSNKTLHKLTDENNMLGKLITLFEKINYIDESLIINLRKVSYIRGYYAHQFYKEDLKNKFLEKNPLIYKQINNNAMFIYSVHNEIVKIDKENRMVAQKAKELDF